MNNTKDGAKLIAAERQRQIEKEGWTHEHDDAHATGELSEAAACYVAVAGAMTRGSTAEEWPASMLNGFHDSILQWPWEEEWWKPVDDQVQMLTKAGALIAAEIDRIQRKLRAGIAVKSATQSARPAAISDADRIDALEELFRHCPHAEIAFNDDPDTESPIGFRLLVEGCETTEYCGPDLRQVLDREVQHQRFQEEQHKD